MRASGLTPAQFWVLNRVYEAAGLSLRELAESLYMDAPTASRVVSTLVRQKLVRTESDATDRRRTRIVVSARGRTLAAKLHVHARQTRASVEASLSASERETLRALLTKALNHVSKL